VFHRQPVQAAQQRLGVASSWRLLDESRCVILHGRLGGQVGSAFEQFEDNAGGMWSIGLMFLRVSGAGSRMLSQIKGRLKGYVEARPG